MTARHRPRQALRGALLDQEEALGDLQAVLVALDLIASGHDGIGQDDMAGLRITIRYARDIAAALRRSWRDAVERVGGRVRPEEPTSDDLSDGN